MNPVWRFIPAFAIALACTPSRALAQLPAGLRPLAIPTGLSASCEIVREPQAIPGIDRPIQRNVEVGDIVEFGAHRWIEAVYDSARRPRLLIELAGESHDGDGVTHTYVVLFLADTVAGGTHMTAAGDARPPVGGPPGAPGADAVSMDDLTAAEGRAAMRLMEWISARECR